MDMACQRASAERDGVRVEASAGRIRLDAAKLIERFGDSFIDSVLERALLRGCIAAVAVDRRHGAITFEYDARCNELAATLTDIAGALQADAPERLPDFQVTLNLRGVPGTVTRVDRVRSVIGEFGATRREGFGWSAFVKRADQRGPHSQFDEGGAAAILEGVVVHYAPEHRARTGRIEQAAIPASAERSQIPERGQPTISGWRRLTNLAAAGGCFTLAIIGFVMPGVPAVPFVLATSYFLVRSVPELNERFRRTWLFGQVVRDWEDSGGMRFRIKIRTLLVMTVALGSTMMIAGGSSTVIATSTAIGALDALLILCLPTVSDEPAGGNSGTWGDLIADPLAACKPNRS